MGEVRARCDLLNACFMLYNPTNARLFMILKHELFLSKCYVQT